MGHGTWVISRAAAPGFGLRGVGGTRRAHTLGDAGPFSISPARRCRQSRSRRPPPPPPSFSPSRATAAFPTRVRGRCRPSVPASVLCTRSAMVRSRTSIRAPISSMLPRMFRPIRSNWVCCGGEGMSERAADGGGGVSAHTLGTGKAERRAPGQVTGMAAPRYTGRTHHTPKHGLH